MEAKRDLTFEEANDKLIYNATTGKIYWRIDAFEEGWSKRFNGKRSGCLHHTGYRDIKLNGRKYREHRVAWLLHYGYLPENNLDHINRDKADNRIENLREINQSCNMKNRIKFKSNSSGVAGITWDKNNKNWVARISVDERLKYISCSKCLDDVVYDRWQAENKYGYPNCNSEESSAYKYLKKKGLLNKSQRDPLKNLPLNNTTGVIGVSYDKRNSNYMVELTVNGVKYNLKRHKTLREAALARLDGEKKYLPNFKKENSSAYSYLKKNKFI